MKFEEAVKIARETGLGKRITRPGINYFLEVDQFGILKYYDFNRTHNYLVLTDDKLRDVLSDDWYVYNNQPLITIYKVFVSLPMAGIDENTIKKTQNAILYRLSEYMIGNDDDFEVEYHFDFNAHILLHNLKEKKEYLKKIISFQLIDTIVTDEVDDAYDSKSSDIRLKYLGESIKKMSEADLVVFDKGWSKAPGCLTEYVTACNYGKPVIVHCGGPDDTVEAYV